MKNRTLRISLILAILTLVTSCFMGSTFAKYVTTDGTSDTARVAKWGVEVSVELPATGGLATSYATTDTANYTGANSVVSSNGDKLVAPGTNGVIMVAEVAGAPEVAVEVKKVANLTLANWEVGGAYYCPIIFTVNGTQYKGTDYTSMVLFEEAVEAALNSTVYFDPNANIYSGVTVSWEWTFEGDDVKDTALGNQAATGNAANFTLSYDITVTQVD